MKSDSNREPVLDVARGIGIILVLFAHLLQWGTVTVSAIFNFHMPLFFFVSGVLFRDDDLTVLERMRKLARSFGVPFFVFLVLGAIIFPLRDTYFCSTRHELAMRVCSFVQGHPCVNGPLWFLVVLSAAHLLCHFIVKFERGKGLRRLLIFVLLLCVSISALSLPTRVKMLMPCMLPVVPIATFFVMSGYELRNSIFRFCRAKISSRFLLLLAAIMATFEIVASMNIPPTTLSAYRLGSVWFVPVAFLGITAILFASKCLVVAARGGLLAQLGRDSLYYFGLDFVMIGITELILAQHLRGSADIVLAVCGLVCQIVLIAACIPLMKGLIGRLKWF